MTLVLHAGLSIIRQVLQHGACTWSYCTMHVFDSNVLIIQMGLPDLAFSNRFEATSGN